MESKNTIKETIFLKSIKDINDFVDDMIKINNSTIMIVNNDDKINAKSIISVLNYVKFNSPVRIEFNTDNENVCGAFLKTINKYKDDELLYLNI